MDTRALAESLEEELHFEIDGVDITEYLNWDGIKYGTNDLDSEEAGRTLDGEMHRSRVATKIRWDLTTKKLTTGEARMILRLIRPEWVTLTCLDLVEGMRTYQVYSNNHSIDLEASGLDAVSGKLLWQEFTFPLIEK